MRIYICSECGREIPPDSNFCYHCGNLKSKAHVIDYDTGPVQEDQDSCPECGKPNNKGVRFCRHCGIEMNTVAPRVETCSAQGTCYQGYPYGRTVMPVLRKNGRLAMLASILFGFLGIHGIGHLVFKRWSRGLMFLTMSAVNWYIYLNVGHFPTIILMISLLLFFKQSMEITNIAYGRA